MESNNDNKNRQLVSLEWAAKHLLNNKEYYGAVECFMSELFERQVKITDVHTIEINKEPSKDKYAYDCVYVMAKDENKELIMIEIRFMMEANSFQCMAYNVTETIVRAIDLRTYMKVKKVYVINIAYSDTKYGEYYVYHSSPIFKGMHYNDILDLSQSPKDTFGRLDVGHIFADCYLFKVNQFDDVIRIPLDEWIYFLKYDRIKEGSNSKRLLEAQEILDYNRLSPSEKEEHDCLQKSRHGIEQ
jgi:hypothetical protein